MPRLHFDFAKLKKQKAREQRQAIAEQEQLDIDNAPPEPETPRAQYVMLLCKLMPSKSHYYALLSNTESPRPRLFAKLHQHGEKLKETRHMVEVWDIGADYHRKMTFTEIEEAGPARFSVFTAPFIFHVPNDAKAALCRVLSRELEADIH